MCSCRPCILPFALSPQKALPILQGRLVDHLRNTHSVSLEDLQTLILDEADRLLQTEFALEVVDGL